MLLQKEFTYKNSKIKILCDKKKLFNMGFQELKKQRRILENYINKDKEFLESLEPVKIRENAPKVVKLMAEAGKLTNTGPMSAVAGTIAELVCKKIESKGGKNVVVENGGDIYCSTKKPITIGIFSGKNKLLGNIGFEIKENLAICSSSSKMGHSYSKGECDLITVFSKKGNIADATATAVCNKIKKEQDINNAIKWGNKIKHIDGIIVIKNDKIGMVGKIPKMIKVKDKKLKQKITKFDFYEL